MHTLSTPLTKEEKHAHNEIAALLSIVPGLGHIYKGHYEMGFLWMFLGMPIAIFVGIISILGTAGVLCALERGWVRAIFLADDTFDLFNRFVLVVLQPLAHFALDDANVIDPMAQ